MSRWPIYVFFSTIFAAAALAADRAPTNVYAESEAFYSTGKMPEWSDFPRTRVLKGFAAYVNRPTTQVEFRHFDYVVGGQAYAVNYFAKGPAASWTLPDFVRVFERERDKYFPLEPDIAEQALKTGFVDGRTVHYIRKAVAEDGAYLLEKFVCLAPAGCDLVFSGAQVFHYLPGQAISYGFFKIE